MTTSIYPVILAGGSGTRLWPLSRTNHPKQFLQLRGESSLLQQTMQRVLNFKPNKVCIVSNEAHYFLCQEQLLPYGVQKKYLLEPCARNTAPAIASAAHHLMQDEGSDAVMLVLPSDHWIADDEAWSRAMGIGAEFAARKNKIVTFGIKPNAPKTGYGYIETAEQQEEQIFSVKSFREKPTTQIAESFIAAKNYFWNSGMFVCRVGTYLDELQLYAPDIYEQSKLAFINASEFNDYLHLQSEAFSKCRSESIDYAIMEKTKNAAIIPISIKWSDLGCWASVAEAREVDENGNSLNGNVIAQNSTGCLVSSEETLVTTIGIKDQIIIATADAILVADKRYSQQVKDIVSNLSGKNSSLTKEHMKVQRPWGHYQVLIEGETFKVKRIMVNPGGKLSLQMHQHRAEHWVVVQGVAEVVNDDKIMHLQANQSTYIPIKTKHRLSNPGSEPLYVIEVQSGGYLGEDDIKRFDDVYSNCRIV